MVQYVDDSGLCVHMNSSIVRMDQSSAAGSALLPSIHVCGAEPAAQLAQIPAGGIRNLTTCGSFRHRSKPSGVFLYPFSNSNLFVIALPVPPRVRWHTALRKPSSLG